MKLYVIFLNDMSHKPCHPQDRDFHGERFTNETHRSTTDPDARLYKMSKGKEASLSYIGNDLIDTKSRVILDTKAAIATGTAEREAALDMVDTLKTYTLSRDIHYSHESRSVCQGNCPFA